MRYFVLAVILAGCGANQAGFYPVQGVAGPTGSPGLNCTVIQETYGVIIRCPDGSEAVVMNGKTKKCHH